MSGNSYVDCGTECWQKVKINRKLSMPRSILKSWDSTVRKWKCTRSSVLSSIRAFQNICQSSWIMWKVMLTEKTIIFFLTTPTKLLVQSFWQLLSATACLFLPRWKASCNACKSGSGIWLRIITTVEGAGGAGCVCGQQRSNTFKLSTDAVLFKPLFR